MIAIVTAETVLGALALAGGVALRLALGPGTALPVQLWLAVDATGGGFLFAGLVRDLWLIAKARRTGGSARPQRTGTEKPICLESLLGSLVVLAGLALLGLGVRHEFRPDAGAIAMWAGAVLIASGLVKDVVLVFRVEKDHGNVILW